MAVGISQHMDCWEGVSPGISRHTKHEMLSPDAPSTPAPAPAAAAADISADVAGWRMSSNTLGGGKEGREGGREWRKGVRGGRREASVFCARFRSES